VILLHSVFRDEREIERELIDPLEHTTVDRLRRFIEYFLDHDYEFVSPQDLLMGLDPRKRWLLLTFDDGYANFLHVLPLLEEYNVPTTLFPVASNIRENRCFWWDVVYRLRRREGLSPGKALQESAKLQALQDDEIDRRLLKQFGERSLCPQGDVDRPLTPDELRALAENPRVSIGNHTADHANLLNYPIEDVRRQVAEAQAWLTEMTGKPPVAVSYPFGKVSDEVMETCRELGLKVGITTVSRLNRIPEDLEEGRLLGLGRFTPSFGTGAQPAREIRRRVLIAHVHETLFRQSPRAAVPEKGQTA
jgi:peptidoglycan/xylan/chitin deacetylase (PgdA/CDA1 family)